MIDTHCKPNEQLFPRQVVIWLATLNKKQTLTKQVNHNINMDNMNK